MASSRRPVFRRGFARKPFESAIELRQRLEADFKRDFADPQIRNAEKFARLLDPRAGNVIDKFGAGHPFEFLAQIIRADGDEVRNSCQGSSSPKCSWMKQRAFQILAGSAWSRLSILPSGGRVGFELIICIPHLGRIGGGRSPWIANSSSVFVMRNGDAKARSDAIMPSDGEQQWRCCGIKWQKGGDLKSESSISHAG